MGSSWTKLASRRVPASRAAFPYVYLKRKHAFVCLSTRARPRPEALGDTFFKSCGRPCAWLREVRIKHGQERATFPSHVRHAYRRRTVRSWVSRARVFAPIENVWRSLMNMLTSLENKVGKIRDISLNHYKSRAFQQCYLTLHHSLRNP